MLLRESGEALGEMPDLAAVVGEGDGGLTHGSVLSRFAEAATRGTPELSEIRSELMAALGVDGFVEAAATVGIFNGLVRIADATGIPLDDGIRQTTVQEREALGIDAFPGSGSTKAATSPGEEESGDVAALFGFK